MQDRRTFLGLAAASLLPIGLEAQTPTPRPPVELARHPLTGPFEGFEVVLVELNIPPGGVEPGPGHVIRVRFSATSSRGRCVSPSTTTRKRCCPWAARSSSRPVRFTPPTVRRGPTGRRVR